MLGIEATGIVSEAPGGEFTTGQQVMAMMGGMGRTYDGGYAEYTCVPASQVIAFDSDLEWGILGAVPEMLQTANGSLTIGLDAQPGESILIRGGTSSIGMATAVLAKQRRLTVLSTTRNPNKTEALHTVGVDHAIIDDGNIADQVRAMQPGGVDNALELIGTPTLPDTLGEPLKKSTIRLRLSMLRVVFEQLIEWDHPDTPARNPILWTDLPKVDEPLPKFLDNQDAAKYMAAAVRPNPQRRLVVEMRARTGLRVTEFCELTHDVIITMNNTNCSAFASANSTPTAPSRYTQASSNYIKAGVPGLGLTTPAGSSQTKAASSTDSAWHAPSPPAPESPESATSTPTNSATPSQPNPSTTA